MTAATASIAQDAKIAEQVLDSLISRSGRSSPVLIKDPHEATHASWHLWLPPHFNTSLDLRHIWKQQVKDKKVVREWKEWIQGGNFCFNEGAIIYDRDVSKCETWGGILELIDFYVVIGETKGVTVRKYKDQETGSRKVERSSGLVTYKVYHPDQGCNSILSSEHTVTQDEFVRFAISGFHSAP